MTSRWMPYRVLDCSLDELIYQEEEFDTPMYRRVLLDALAMSGGLRVLDAGCGTGFVSRLIAAQYPTCQVYGVDIDADMIRTAEFRAASLRRRPLFLQRDVFALDFSDGHFDRVVCQFFLCNQLDIEQALAEMMRVLRSGGRLVCIEPVNSKAVLSCVHEPWAETVRTRWRRRLQNLSAKGVDLDIGKRLPEILCRLSLQSIQVTGCMRISAGIGFLPLQYYAHTPSQEQLQTNLEQVLAQPVDPQRIRDLFELIQLKDELMAARASFGSLGTVPVLVVSGEKTR